MTPGGYSTVSDSTFDVRSKPLRAMYAISREAGKVGKVAKGQVHKQPDIDVLVY